MIEAYQVTRVQDILSRFNNEEKILLQKYLSPSSTNANKKRSQFTSQEDEKLKQLVKKYGDNNWVSVANEMGDRNVRQCRERWRHYLTPDVCNSEWSIEEDNLLKAKYAIFGPKWVQITEFFKNRTDISIKNRWIVLMRKGFFNNEEKKSEIKAPEFGEFDELYYSGFDYDEITNFN